LCSAVSVLVAVAAGCGGSYAFRSASALPPKAVEQVDAIDLWVVPPAAINWDDVPGPDGVQVTVFLYQADHPEPVFVKGTLEFSMYEGRRPREALSSAEPLRTWTFTQQELATRQMHGPAGWGYGTQLGWGRDVPKSSVITLVVRYTPPRGPPMSSVPTVIAVPQ
jgi:hypothetical protein